MKTTAGLLLLCWRTRGLARASPLQLVKPSRDHTRLETCEAGLQFLRDLDAPVAVISAVGAIHSGKSFLLNQLLGVTNRDTGFSVGYTVNPETSGLWLWNTPLRTGGTAVIFLDTEGLFAHNVSSQYDARLFAIATLLSSEIIYNTVKFIDSHHVDALELLIRRTNLFGLRAYAKQSLEFSPPSHNIPNLSAFLRLLVPNQLSWVIQDFVQDLGKRPPEEWLQDVLEKNRRDTSDHAATSSFGTLFQHIDCIPLAVPSGDPEVLQRLDTADSSKFNPAYVRGIDQMRERLLTRAVQHPKLKAVAQHGGSGRGVSPMSGLDVANLVEFLVQAANSGETLDNSGQPFPQIQSMAEQFRTLQLKLMKSDIIAILEKDLTSIIHDVAQKARPLNNRELTGELEKAERQADALWNATMKGLVTQQEVPAEMEASKQEFVGMMAQVREKICGKNCELVKEWCARFTENLLGELRKRIAEQSREASLPVVFDAQLESLVNPIRNEFIMSSISERRAWTFWNKTDCCSASSNGDFTGKINEILRTARESNDRLISGVLSEAVMREVDVWKREMEKARDALLRSEEAALLVVLKELRDEAGKRFEAQCHRFKSLTSYVSKRGELMSKLGLLEGNFKNEWDKECSERIQLFKNTSSTRFGVNLRRRVSLPALEASLERAIAEEVEALTARYREAIFCHGSQLGRSEWAEQVAMMAVAAERLREGNIQTMKDVSGAPLESLKTELLELAESFYSPRQFEQFAREKALGVLSKAVEEYVERAKESAVDDLESVSKGQPRASQLSRAFAEKAAESFVKEDLKEASTKVNCVLSWAIIMSSLVAFVSLYLVRGMRLGGWWTALKNVPPLVVLLAVATVSAGRQFAWQLFFPLALFLFNHSSFEIYWAACIAVVAFAAWRLLLAPLRGGGETKEPTNLEPPAQPSNYAPNNLIYGPSSYAGYEASSPFFRGTPQSKAAAGLTTTHRSALSTSDKESLGSGLASSSHLLNQRRTAAPWGDKTVRHWA